MRKRTLYKTFLAFFQKCILYCTLFSLVYIIGGCGVRTVYLPVSVCTQPPIVQMKPLATDNLAKESTPSETIKAFVKDIIYLKGYATSLEVILEGYRKQPQQYNGFSTEDKKM